MGGLCVCLQQWEGAAAPADRVTGTCDLILEEQMASCCWKAFGVHVCMCKCVRGRVSD